VNSNDRHGSETVAEVLHGISGLSRPHLLVGLRDRIVWKGSKQESGAMLIDWGEAEAIPPARRGII
jgi:hypothetical protein